MKPLIRRVSVGTMNPAKIEAVKLGFIAAFKTKNWEVKGQQVASGVTNQPMSDAESIMGARTRALAAIKRGGEFGVGLEGGLGQIGDLWFDCGWIVVIDQEGNEGIGSTARIITPPAMMTEILRGKELGEVVDQFFGTTNAKQKNGHFGLMTNDAITRITGYRDGVVMALARFLQPWLFP